MRKGLSFLVISLLIVGCATATPTQKGAVAGSAIGAGFGAIIGHQSGNTAEGALIGAAAGGLAGGLAGDAMATKFCPACGRQYFSGDTYCTLHNPPVALKQKGTVTPTVQDQQAQAGLPKFCSTCGEAYAADVTYCPKDGTALKSKQP